MMPAPKPTTGEQALNAALRAGFTITRHAGTAFGHFHDLRHTDGRSLTIYTITGTGRFQSAQGHNRHRWNTPRLSAHSVPALRRMLAA